jgi:hypothetical protein
MSVEIIETIVGSNHPCEFYADETSSTAPCPRMATTVVKGEEDSFGYEPMYMCDQCLARYKANVASYEEAADVEDREGFFVVSETNNYDTGRGYFLATKSFREATAFLRKIRESAARHGGIYPNKGIREFDEKGYIDALLRQKEVCEREAENDAYWSRVEEEQLEFDMEARQVMKEASERKNEEEDYWGRMAEEEWEVDREERESEKEALRLKQEEEAYEIWGSNDEK